MRDKAMAATPAVLAAARDPKAAAWRKEGRIRELGWNLQQLVRVAPHDLLEHIAATPTASAARASRARRTCPPSAPRPGCCSG